MPSLVLATHNQGKIREIREYLAEEPMTFLSLKDFSDVPTVVEDGASFEANAIKKARQTAEFLNRWALADDSGLEVRFLNGRPGVLSARYAGEDASDAANNAKLLKELADTAPGQRQARFVCVIAIASPLGHYRCWHACCEGEITLEPRGKQGFGYDPLFWVPQIGKTFAELDHREKARWSHRGRALRELRRDLQKKSKFFAKISNVSGESPKMEM